MSTSAPCPTSFVAVSSSRSVMDYEEIESDKLEFDVGDEIVKIGEYEKDNSWWLGRLVKSGTEGYFRANLVRPKNGADGATHAVGISEEESAPRSGKTSSATRQDLDHLKSLRGCLRIFAFLSLTGAFLAVLNFFVVNELTSARVTHHMFTSRTQTTNEMIESRLACGFVSRTMKPVNATNAMSFKTTYYDACKNGGNLCQPREQAAWIIFGGVVLLVSILVTCNSCWGFEVQVQGIFAFALFVVSVSVVFGSASSWQAMLGDSVLPLALNRSLPENLAVFEPRFEVQSVVLGRSFSVIKNLAFPLLCIYFVICLFQLCTEHVFEKMKSDGNSKGKMYVGCIVGVGSLLSLCGLGLCCALIDTETFEPCVECAGCLCNCCFNQNVCDECASIFGDPIRNAVQGDCPDCACCDCNGCDCGGCDVSC